jgi:hypothetical protein
MIIDFMGFEWLCGFVRFHRALNFKLNAAILFKKIPNFSLFSVYVIFQRFSLLILFGLATLFLYVPMIFCSLFWCGFFFLIS